jgi:hypothetical protein
MSDLMRDLELVLGGLPREEGTRWGMAVLTGEVRQHEWVEARLRDQIALLREGLLAVAERAEAGDAAGAAELARELAGAGDNLCKVPLTYITGGR